MRNTFESFRSPTKGKEKSSVAHRDISDVPKSSLPENYQHCVAREQASETLFFKESA